MSPLVSCDGVLIELSRAQAQNDPPSDDRSHNKQTGTRAYIEPHKFKEHLATHKPQHERDGRLEERQVVHRLRDDYVNASQRHDGKQVACEHHERVLPTQDGRNARGMRDQKRRASLLRPYHRSLEHRSRSLQVSVGKPFRR